MQYHEWHTKYDRLAAVSAKVKHYASAYLKYRAAADKKHLQRYLNELDKLMAADKKPPVLKQGELM